MNGEAFQSAGRGMSVADDARGFTDIGCVVRLASDLLT
jgi:hypothetical protein